MRKPDTVRNRIIWWVLLPFRLVLLIVLSPVLLPLLAVGLAWDWWRKRKFRMHEEEKKIADQRRLEAMQKRIIVSDESTEWNMERYRDFLGKVSGLRKALAESIHSHPVRARLRGNWCCDLKRRFPGETRAIFAMLPRLTVKNRILPTIGNMQSIGAELHFDGGRMKVESNESADALVERTLLRYVSGQLFLFWHALYDEELLCFSLEQFLSMGDGRSWSGKNVYHRQLDDVMRARLSVWPWMPRTGRTSEGELVVEYLTIKPYRPSGILLHRATFDRSAPFGICDVVVDRIPFANFVNF